MPWTWRDPRGPRPALDQRGRSLVEGGAPLRRNDNHVRCGPDERCSCECDAELGDADCGEVKTGLEHRSLGASQHHELVCRSGVCVWAPPPWDRQERPSADASEPSGPASTGQGSAGEVRR